MKFPLRDLNPDPCLPHPTSTYTCRVTAAPKVRGGHLTKVSLCKFCLLITMQRLEGSDWLVN